MSTKGDDILNVALGTEDEVREIYARKAESRNENLIVRNYIPPNFYSRYMYLNNVCSEKRNEDSNLKTQLRLGRKDIEIYTKQRGEEQGFKKVELEEFTDVTLVPGFDNNVKWRIYTDKPQRKKSSQWEDKGERPSAQHKQRNSKETGNRQTWIGNGKPANRKDPIEKPLVRNNSNSTSSKAKKPSTMQTIHQKTQRTKMMILEDWKMKLWKNF